MIHEVLNQRENLYGDFTALAPMAQALKQMFRHTPSAAKRTDIQNEVLDAIAVKLARIMNGDPLHPDNWQDIAGYASLAHEEIIAATLPKAEPVKAPVITQIAAPSPYAKVDAAAKAVLDSVNDPVPAFLTNTARVGEPNDHRGNGKKDKSL